MSQNRDMEHPVQLEVVNPPVPFGARTGHTASGVVHTGGGLALRKSPRPSGCSRFVRREIADAMPSICAMLLTRVMDGDLASLKLLLQMAVDGQSAEREGLGRSAGFGRKVLVGFKDWEARETGLRRES